MPAFNKDLITAALFWVSVILMFHSYVVYPFFLMLFSRKKLLPNIPANYTPDVVVLMAVYNADWIIEQKICSVLESDYPKEKITFLIGVDFSSENIKQLLNKLDDKYPQLRLKYYGQRTGKVRIMNELYQQAMEENKDKKGVIFISTDATALFDKACIRNLVKYFLNSDVAAVGANIVKTNIRHDGISFQEKKYYDREMEMKYEEGILWASVIGVFGACFAIRPSEFRPVPENFIADDFYLTMNILERKGKVLFDMDAKVYMNLINESSREYKRKVRISSGNFQNLARFWKLLFRFNGVSLGFLSHKVLRWFGPFFIIISFICSLLLLEKHFIYQFAFYIQAVFLLFPLFNFMLEQLNIHQRIVKFIAHFYLMNLGVLVGFIKYLGGIRTSVWEPTKR